jgi:hypothetical protein
MLQLLGLVTAYDSTISYQASFDVPYIGSDHKHCFLSTDSVVCAVYASYMAEKYLPDRDNPRTHPLHAAIMCANGIAYLEEEAFSIKMDADVASALLSKYCPDDSGFASFAFEPEPAPEGPFGVMAGIFDGTSLTCKTGNGPLILDDKSTQQFKYDFSVRLPARVWGPHEAKVTKISFWKIPNTNCGDGFSYSADRITISPISEDISATLPITATGFSNANENLFNESQCENFVAQLNSHPSLKLLVGPQKSFDYYIGQELGMNFARRRVQRRNGPV